MAWVCGCVWTLAHALGSHGWIDVRHTLCLSLASYASIDGVDVDVDVAMEGCAWMCTEGKEDRKREKDIVGGGQMN